MRRSGSPINPDDEIYAILEIWFEDCWYLRNRSISNYRRLLDCLARRHRMTFEQRDAMIDAISLLNLNVEIYGIS